MNGEGVRVVQMKSVLMGEFFHVDVSNLRYICSCLGQDSVLAYTPSGVSSRTYDLLAVISRRKIIQLCNYYRLSAFMIATFC